MICTECKRELSEEEERTEEVSRYGICSDCYKCLIDFLVLLKLESKYR